MVKVNVEENRLNSHVGKVMVLKVTNQRSSPGITLNSSTRKRPPVCKRSYSPESRGIENAETEAETLLFTRDELMLDEAILNELVY